MIVRPRPGLRATLFATRGSIVRRIAGRAILFMALACGVVVWAQFYQDPFSNIGTAPFTLVGLSISIFMSFRNSACYDRWWEGRKQWGQLIFEVRSFARETSTLKERQARADMLRGLCGFAHTLAARLRDKDEGVAASPWLREAGNLLQSPNIADAILVHIGATCSALAERGAISEWRYGILESRLSGLSGAQAACERIKNTPVPFAYTLLIHRTVYVFCCLLPFGLVGQLGWMTPFLVTVLSYAFLGLDALAAELEEPFGRTENGLPLDALVRIVEREVLAALGAQMLPAALEPDNFRLL